MDGVTMKARNHVIWTGDEDTRRALYEEYIYLGREARLHEDRVVVFSLSQVSKKKQREAQKSQPKANYSKRERLSGVQPRE